MEEMFSSLATPETALWKQILFLDDNKMFLNHVKNTAASQMQNFGQNQICRNVS